MFGKFFLKSFLKNSVISLVILSTILGTMGPFLFSPQIAWAAAPNIMHMPVGLIDGDESSAVSVEFFTTVSDDSATPTSTPPLVVYVHSTTTDATFAPANASWWNSTTTCSAVETDTSLHRCILTNQVAAGVDGRKFQYYIEAGDGNATSSMSYSSTNTTTSAQAAPFQATVYNTPSWTNVISGLFTTTTAEWPGVKDGRYANLAYAAPIATSTIYIASTTANMSIFGNAPNTWIIINGVEKYQILATSTDIYYGGEKLQLTLSGYLRNAYNTSNSIYKFLAGATVFIAGANINTTTSDQQATSTYGTFVLRNVPDGSHFVNAFKRSYKMTVNQGVFVSGTATTTIDFFLPSGYGWGGGGDLEGPRVTWSGPMDGTPGAPTNIGLTFAPIVIGFSENLATTTASSTANVLLKKVNPDGTRTAVSNYTVAYDYAGKSPGTGNIGGTDAKIIVYSSTALATSSQYVVEITSDVTDVLGNQVMGNRPGGGHAISFGTMGGSFQAGQITAANFGTSGAYMPPFVMNAIPRMGEINVARNTKIALEFDQAIDATTLDANIQLWRLGSTFNEVSAVSISRALSTSNSKRVIITPPTTAASALAANTRYRIKILGGLKATSGVGMARPGEEANTMFTAEFETGATFDNTAPTKVSSSLDRYLNAAGSIVGAPTAGAIKVSLSKMVNPDTITASTLYLRVYGSTDNITGTATYDIMEGKAVFVPSTALNATTTHVLTLTAGITDFTTTSNAMTADTVTFTTGAPDATGPRLEFFNADDTNLSLTFDETMNAARVTDTAQWSSGETKWNTSVLNPRNYIVYADSGAPPASTALYFNCANLAGTTTDSGCNTVGTSVATFDYDFINKTVKISGLKLRDPAATSGSFTPGGVRVWVKNVTDASGNTIQTNASPDAEVDNFGANSMGGPVMSSQNTFGMVGPGGGGMMGAPTTAGTTSITDFGGKNPAMMGMMPVGVWPMNMVAGATSTYMIDIPISSGKAIPNSGRIILGPFPDEANVSLATNSDPNKQFSHKDLNGPGQGTVQINSVSVSGQIITVILSVGGGYTQTGAPDFLHLELSKIKNPTTPAQGGYKINIQTQDNGGRQLESFTSMPFFIMPKGKYFIVGNVTSTDVGLNGVNIFGGSPSTGPLSAATYNNAFGSSTDGEFKFEGLNAGSVMLMTEPSVSVGSDEYIASMGEPIFLDDTMTADSSGAARDGVRGCTSQTACYYYKKITLTRMAAATTPGLVVYIYGDFSALGATDIDIFAGGPNGFRVKQVTIPAADYSVTPYPVILYLPAIGDYHIGMGPAMPKGPMGTAAPPRPTGWMPPKPVELSVSGSGGTWTWTERGDTSATATSTSDGLVQFAIQVANKTITGYVYDSSGVAVSNAEVFAYSPTEMFGNSTHARTDGSFTLNVKTGFYKVGAFLPGAPPSGETGVEVRSDSTLYVDGTLASSVTLRLSKAIQSGYTISGTVYSDTASKYPASDASVSAFRTDGPGHVETMTDSKGTYTLYVGAGTWTVGAYLPTHGKVAEQTVTVPPSKSSLNFTPDTTVTYVTIRDNIWQDADDNGIFTTSTEGIARAAVTVISTSTDYSITAMTDANGAYEVKVPANRVYDIQVWSPDLGNLPIEKNVSLTADAKFTGIADIRIEQATTVEFGFYDSNGNATSVSKALIQMDKMGVAGVSNDVYKESITTTTLQVATSTTPYILDIEVQGIPKELLTISPQTAAVTAITTTTVGSTLFATTTVNGYEKIKVILPPLCNISGQVLDASGTAVPNAIIHVEQPGKDIEFDVEANASGNYAFVVASSTTPYLIQADKGGYIDVAASVYASTSALTFNPQIEAASYTISGTVTLNNSAPNNSCYIWAEKLGGGYVSTTGNCNSSTGVYSIKVVSGDWEVSSAIEGYTNSTRSTIASVSSANVTGVNFNITATKTLQETETLGMTGNAGGSLVNKDSGFEMNIPRSTLSASDSSSYNVKEKEISNIPGYTPTGNLVGDKAEEISAYKMSGSNGNVSTVSGLNGSAFVDKIFTAAELAAEGIDTVAEVEQTKMGSYDDTAQNWTNLPTTITYLNYNNVPVVPTTTDFAGINKVVFNGVTKHFSTLGVINTTYDGLPPAAPTSVTVTDVGNSQLRVSWTAVTKNSDGTDASDLLSYAVYRANSTAGPWTKIVNIATTTTSYTDTVPSWYTTYYYKVTADTGLQSEFSGSAGASAFGTSGGGGGGGGGGGIALAPTPTTATSTATTTTPTTPAPTTPAPVPTVPAKKEVSLEGITIPILEKAVAQMTKSELLAKIAEFVAVVNQLKELLTQLTSAAISGVPSDFKFKTTIKLSQSSDDIKYLQIVLNSDPDTKIASSGAGSPGKETKYFGALTKAAVIKFQEKYASEILTPLGLTKGTGILGSSTRAKLNTLLGK